MFLKSAKLLSGQVNIKTVPVVPEGAVRVIRTNDEGHELFLYIIESGEACTVSLSCCSTLNPSGIKAMDEDENEIQLRQFTLLKIV